MFRISAKNIFDFNAIRIISAHQSTLIKLADGKSTSNLKSIAAGFNVDEHIHSQTSINNVNSVIKNDVIAFQAPDLCELPRYRTNTVGSAVLGVAKSRQLYLQTKKYHLDRHRSNFNTAIPFLKLPGQAVYQSTPILGVRFASTAAPVNVPQIQLSGIWKDISESAPVELVQNSLLQLHNTTGLPWWATIMLGTFLIRGMLTLPLSLYQHYILAKVENLNKEMNEFVKELNKETARAIKQFKWSENETKMHYRRSINKHWDKLVVRDNCHPAKSMILMWVQFPVWIVISSAIRNICYMLPYRDANAQAIYEELMTGGFGWIPNLVAVDQYWILPITLGLLNLTNIEIQTMLRSSDPSRMQRYLINFLRLVSIGLIPLASYVPSGLSLYWVTSSACAFAQNLILVSPKVKRLVGIPPIASERKTPYSDLAEKIKERITLRSKR